MSYIKKAFDDLTEKQKEIAMSVAELSELPEDDEALFELYDMLCDKEIEAIMSSSKETEISDIVTAIGNSIAENEGYSMD